MSKPNAPLSPAFQTQFTKNIIRSGPVSAKLYNTINLQGSGVVATLDASGLSSAGVNTMRVINTSGVSASIASADLIDGATTKTLKAGDEINLVWSNTWVLMP